MVYDVVTFRAVRYVVLGCGAAGGTVAARRAAGGPAARRPGLPTGLQLAGRRGGDLALLRASAAAGELLRVRED